MIQNKTNLYTILLLSITCLAFAFPAQAQDKESEILVSSKIAKGSDVSYVKKLENGTLSLQNSTMFNVQARITPATEEKEVLFEQTLLEPPSDTLKCRNSSCTWNWNFELGSRDISIMDRPKLEMAWKQSQYGETPRIEVYVAFTSQNATGNNRTEKITGIFQGGDKAQFEEYKSLDIKSAAFTEKSKRYLAKRELGLSADQRWRYSMDGESLVLQRRVDIPLANATAVRIVADKDYAPEMINFSIDRDGNGLRDTYVLDRQTEKDVEIRDGLAIITINLKRALEKKNIDLGKAVLMEPILFMPMSYHRFEKLRPLYKIFFGSLTHQRPDVIHPEVQKKGEYNSLVFDLAEKLNQSGMWDAIYKNLQVQIEANSPQLIKWRRHRLFSSFKDMVPKILLQPGKSLKQWGIDKPHVERFERVASVDPILKAYPALPSNTLKMSDLFSGSYKGRILSVTGENQLFSVKKDNDYIRIQGGPQKGHGKSFIKIFPQEKDMILGFTSNCMLDISLKSLGGKIYNMSWQQFLDKGRFHLPQNTGMLLEVSPYANAANREISNSTDPSPWLLEIHKKYTQNLNDLDYNSVPGAQITLKASNIIRDALVYYTRGIRSLTALLTYQRKGNTKQEEVTLGDGAGYLDFLEKGDKILDLDLLYWSRDPASSEEPQVVIFNVAHSKQFALSDASSQWIVQDKLITLNPKNRKQQNSADKTYIYPPEKINFNLDSDRILSIDKVFFDNQLPEECGLKIQKNQCLFNTVTGTGKSRPVQSLYPVHNIELQVGCSGNEPLYSLSLPKIDCFGYKQSIGGYLKEIEIRIGNNTYPVNADINDINQASWCNATSVTLGKGQHDISVTGNEFFHVDSVLLKTDSKIYSLDELKEEKGRSSGIFKKLLALAKKLAILAVIIVLIYIFRRPIKFYLGGLWGGFKKMYGLLSEKSWLVIWLILAFVLYGWGLLAKVDQGGTAVSFAGLCLLAAFWHFMRLIEGKMRKVFPKMSEYIYYSKGKIFFAGAIFLLLCTALFVALGLEPVAEQLAVIVYYQLVAGVVWEIIDLKKDQRRKQTDEPEQL